MVPRGSRMTSDKAALKNRCKKKFLTNRNGGPVTIKAVLMGFIFLLVLLVVFPGLFYKEKPCMCLPKNTAAATASIYQISKTCRSLHWLPRCSVLIPQNIFPKNLYKKVLKRERCTSIPLSDFLMQLCLTGKSSQA